MRFKVDENLPAEVAELLRADGHEADTVREEGLAGEDDPMLAARIQAEARAIITADLDFGDIRAYPPCEYAGIIVFRPRPQGKRALLALGTELVPLLRSQSPDAKLWVLRPDGLRVHQDPLA